ncbi:MAG: hypothetical protein KDK50_02860 [Chlamydiia bacterium]|nr:hypothetical protein [Chlamydiia bacterium]
MKVELPKPLIDFSLWNRKPAPIWTLSLFTLRRNLAHYPFPHCLNAQERQLVSNTFKTAIVKHTNAPYLLNLQQLQPVTKTYLAEHYYWQNSMQRLQSGSLVCIPTNLEWQALINGNDHLTIQHASLDSTWTDPYRKLYEIEDALAHQIAFAYHSQFGYLTSSLAHVGTGLSLQIFLHLPLLIQTQKIQDYLLQLLPEGISAKGLSQNPNHYLGDLLVLHNPYCTGKSETDLLHRMHTIANEMVAAESDLRAALRNHPKDEWIDRTTRAYGLLRHSYKLSTKEALTHLSLLKLGSNLGWLEGLSDADCNTLFFQMRRGHLKFLAPDSPDPETARAHLMKKALAPTTLTI